MPTIKQILWAVAAGILVSLVTAIIGFLSAARLEISFDKLKDFEITDLKSYKALGTSVKFDLQLSEPREFVAFWGENDDGKTVVQKSDVHFKNFKLSSRIEGDISIGLKPGDVKFNIIGYYNSDRIVFSHRGPINGVGVYILDLFQVRDFDGEIFVGYSIFEDVKGQNKVWITQCPIVMIQQTAGAKAYSTIEDAQKAFSVLRAQCTEFKMPELG
jgi:hypothetical protein